MTDEAWIAYRNAAALIGDERRVFRALMLDEIKSRGQRATSAVPEDIPASLWGEWSFLPIFDGPLSEKMRGLVWLVPPGTELSRVCRGLGDLRLLRADVERLAARPAIEPAAEPAPPAEVAADKPPAPKETLARFLAAKLREAFPDGPPNLRLSEQAARIRDENDKTIGSFTERTLIRARTIAWPQLKKAPRD